MASGEVISAANAAVLGRQLRRWRESAGLSQERLALRCGLSVRTIRNVEGGRRSPHDATLGRLLDALPLDDTARQQVEQTLRKGTPEPQQAASARRSAGVSPAQLPADVRAFTGRAADLCALDAALVPGSGNSMSEPTEQAQGTPVVAVVGMAGAGKTSLAVHWAHRAHARWPDGQLFVDLCGYDPRSRVDAVDALAQLLRGLGVPEQEWPVTLQERAARYRSELARRRVLVLLDNAWSVEQIRPLLPGSSQCAVIVTSRDALAGLVVRDGARRISIGPLPADDAVDLLQNLLGEREAGATSLGPLADLCDRLPLALRVAAELVQRRPETTLEDLVEGLRHHHDRLSRLRQPADERADLPAVFSWSLMHLPDGDARAFAYLGLHPGPTVDRFLLAALSDTCVEAAAASLEALSDAHLVYPVAGGRYRMHDLMREYARSLDPAGGGQPKDAAAAGRLMRYLRVAAETAVRRLYTPGQGEPVPAGASVVTPAFDDPQQCLEWLDAEEDNICAAVARYGPQEPREAIALSVALSRYLVAGHSGMALRIHAAALRAAEQIDDTQAVVQILNSLGNAHLQRGQPASARNLFLRALGLARSTSDRVGEARCLLGLGHCEGQVSASVERFTEALTLYRELGDRDGQARCLTNLGFALERLDRPDAASVHLAEAAVLARADGNHELEANIVGGLGDVTRRLGDREAALAHHERALGIFETLGVRDRVAWALNSIGADLHDIGDLNASTTAYRAALEIFEMLEEPTGQAHALNGLAETLLDLGQTAPAHRRFARALVVAEGLVDRQQAARAHAGMMATFRRSGRLDRARRHGELARAIFLEMGLPEADVVRRFLGEET